MGGVPGTYTEINTEQKCVSIPRPANCPHWISLSWLAKVATAVSASCLGVVHAKYYSILPVKC